jgi:hypothetical protein
MIEPLLGIKSKVLYLYLPQSPQKLTASYASGEDAYEVVLRIVLMSAAAASSYTLSLSH